MTFGQGFVRTYAEAWRALAALPLLAVAIVGVEGLQHVVEWMSGMYVSQAAAHQTAAGAGRMLAGTLKVLWLCAIGYWVSRLMVSGSPQSAVRLDPTAVRKYAAVMAYSTVLALLFILPPVLAPVADRRAVSIAALVFQIVSLPLGVALTPWVIGSALGDRRATPGFGFRRSWGSLWWGLAMTLLTVIPVMAIHYALGLGAVGKPAPLAILMLVADTLMVGYLGLLTSTGPVVVAERMAERAGESLVVAA